MATTETSGILDRLTDVRDAAAARFAGIYLDEQHQAEAAALDLAIKAMREAIKVLLPVVEAPEIARARAEYVAPAVVEGPLHESELW